MPAYGQRAIHICAGLASGESNFLAEDGSTGTDKKGNRFDAEQFSLCLS
jgi:hypothetical protein